MKTACTALLVFLIMTVGTYVYSADRFRLTGRAGEYSLTITFDKSQPATGRNRMYIEVVDTSQKSVTNAAIQVHYYMPSLPGKQPMMENTTNAKRSGAGYEADLYLDMKGEWKVDIILEVSGRRREVLMAFQAE
ncbi:MAG TPA: FixH family protein [Syntrophorhabdaceae bacterium]|nr:FixH family protein [Syntrophorhabdaceae bacterium]